MNRIFKKIILQVIVIVGTILISYAQQAKGPILQIQTNTTDFDTTYCNTTKCKSVTFSNVGDTLLHVSYIENTQQPFQSNIPSSFSLKKNESHAYSLCYHPNTAPIIDSQRIKFIADNRISLSIALLFDVSESMNEMDIFDSTKMDYVTRISASHDAGTDFLDGLMNTFGIQDEAAVYSFASYNAFINRQNFSSDTLLLKNAVPSSTIGTALGSNTCLYSSIMQAINQLQPRLKKRVLIALTDGNENCDVTSPSPDEVIQSAKSAGVTLFTIGIGSADATVLAQMANATGGTYFTATNQSDLIAVYRSIATLVSKNVEGSIFMKGRGVTSSPILDPPILNFDSVKVGRTKYMSCIIRNVGDGPLIINNVSTTSSPFTLYSLHGDTLVMGFTPTDLSIKTSRISINTNSCIVPTVSLSLHGVGYDNVTIDCKDTIRGKPGSVISVPVLLHDKIPTNYNVTSMKIVLRYNKTMLYPVAQPINTSNTLTQSMNNMNSTTTFTAHDATTTFNLSGDAISNSVNDAILVRFNFLVLHGNALTTPITLVSSTFADGNPRVNVESSAYFIADSLCNQDQRLIDATARIENKLGQNTPNPISLQNPSTNIRYSIAEPNWTRLIVYDALGREVTRLVDEYKSAGEYEVMFNAKLFSSGLYFYRIESGSFTDLKKMFLIK